MEQELNITNSEMIVMRVIWALGHAKVEDISHQISKRQDWSLATVKTLLGRLVKKDMLETEKDGRCFVYHPLIGEEEAIRLLTRELMTKICATKQALAISDAIEQACLTAQDVATLTNILQQKKTVESIECSCLDDDSDCHCKHHK
ncbi:MAG: CopY/TcrY family copper transport repressor [Streptococcaceae bacterium]|jgi:CopY/TcrY family copper transport repressor|nr:CopY/TcrY family copper transport repressor [Streptococcaceae bacterium]